MRVDKRIEVVIVTLLYFTCLWLWSLPFQDNELPYGEVDAASHFAVADYTTQTDKSITTLPYYIDKRYGKDNSFKNHVLWYAPPYHMAFSIAQIIGGERILPVFLVNAIFSSLVFLSVYFIMRKFFGFVPALLSGFMLMFSMRDIMVYLWGQWPERMGFAYIPLVLYCFYRYVQSFLDKKEKPVYLYILVILLSANFFIHPMTFLHIVVSLVLLFVFTLIKERKIFFNYKHVLVSILIFLAIISIFPYQTMNVVVRLMPGGDPSPADPNAGNFARLFFWSKGMSAGGSVPDSYFSYKDMIGDYWTILLLLAGLIFILFRRNQKDVVLLAWLSGLYIMVHLDVLGQGGRVHRSLSATAHIFYPLIVIGLWYLLSYSKYFKQYQSYIKYGLIVVFAALIVFSNGNAAYLQLKGAYSGVLRMTPYQADASAWVKENLPRDSNVYSFGALTQAKSRWMWMISDTYLQYIRSFSEESLDNYTHVLLDYSDRVIINDQDTTGSMQSWEQENLAGDTLLYDKGYIKVYKLEN